MNDNFENDQKMLMHSAKEGDVAAFGQLYEIYFTPIYRYIYLRVRNKAEAEDLVQGVFLKVYQSVGDFEERGSSPLAYFYTIARNTVIDFWRKKKEVVENPEEILVKIPTPEESPQASIEKKETMAGVEKALENLTDEQQEVVIMKFINDLSNKEISEILGKSEEAIRQLQCRALKALRKNLESRI
jgi:RNA polymerase sigma-70 factor (ECF subfamily)